MNKERIIEIANVIRGKVHIPTGYWEAKDDGCFSMQEYFSGYGTPLCIAGHVIAGYGHKDETPRNEHGIVDYKGYARDLLGLSQEQALNLFIAWNTYMPLSQITPEIAYNTLMHLAETGEVIWGNMEVVE